MWSVKNKANIQSCFCLQSNQGADLDRAGSDWKHDAAVIRYQQVSTCTNVFKNVLLHLRWIKSRGKKNDKCLVCRFSISPELKTHFAFRMITSSEYVYVWRVGQHCSKKFIFRDLKCTLLVEKKRQFFFSSRYSLPFIMLTSGEKVRYLWALSLLEDKIKKRGGTKKKTTTKKTFLWRNLRRQERLMRSWFSALDQLDWEQVEGQSQWMCFE